MIDENARQTIVSTLADFVAGSARGLEEPQLVLDNAAAWPGVLVALGDRFGARVEPLPIEDFGVDPELSESFTDRVIEHRANKIPGLHRLYAGILSRLGVDQPLEILEIGIGTVDPTRVSHNPDDYRPGGSLRAFRDFCPQARVYGADVDPTVLFEEERIRTALVDQRDPASFRAMHESFGQPRYDLVVDDGLHAISFNLQTLLFALDVVAVEGWIVIEDIWTAHDGWRTVHRLLADAPFDRHLFQLGDGSWVFALRRRPTPGAWRRPVTSRQPPP